MKKKTLWLWGSPVGPWTCWGLWWRQQAFFGVYYASANKDWVISDQLEKQKAAFLAGATAQRMEDSKRAERFDAWFDRKEPRGKILSEEILAAPLAEYVAPSLEVDSNEENKA